jgi:hypothetical protein
MASRPHTPSEYEKETNIQWTFFFPDGRSNNWWNLRFRSRVYHEGRKWMWDCGPPPHSSGRCGITYLSYSVVPRHLKRRRRYRRTAWTPKILFSLGVPGTSIRPYRQKKQSLPLIFEAPRSQLKAARWRSSSMLRSFMEALELAQATLGMPRGGVT